MRSYTRPSNTTVSSEIIHTQQFTQPIQIKHACTHGHLHTLWSMSTHTHRDTTTNVHTQTQTLMQQNSNNRSSTLMIITVTVAYMPGESVCGLQKRGEVGPQWGGIMPWTDRQKMSSFKVCRGAAGHRPEGRLRREHQTLKLNHTRQEDAAPVLRNNVNWIKINCNISS